VIDIASAGRPLLWQLAACAPDQWLMPADIAADANWIEASVPGTVAAALEAAGLWTWESGAPLDASDYWYRAEIAGMGPARLRFEGLATLAEIFLDGRRILVSDNMFVAHEIDVDLAGVHRLHLRFKALAPVLAQKRKRPRWKTRVASPATLRFIRTSLLGYMPGWCPPKPVIGPWRPVTLTPTALAVEVARLAATLDGRCGVLDVALRTAPGARLEIACAASRGLGVADADGQFRLQLRIDDVPLWWPHTHGAPVLHAVTARQGNETTSLGRVGFRSIAMDRGPDGKGFGLVVNGEPLFCRGACWVPPDPTGLSADRATYAPILTAMRAAGMNMVRVGGTMVYEGDAFYALCDELGLLVWQDFMFASFDYPSDDPAFAASVKTEARQFLFRTQSAACLAVLCGASEVGLQAAMFGLPPETWSAPLFDEELASLCATTRPDVPYLPQTPFGGPLPFVANEGVSHYYGVSAHMRPLDDARRAEVRFAAECLCFANLPEGPVALDDGPATRQPVLAARVDGDTNAVWFFETVRNFYLAELYGVDPATLRAADPARYVELSRAVSGEVMEQVLGTWRRAGSPTRGALLWFLKDVMPGAGWGVLDATGAPKPAYWGVKRAFKPVTVVLTDEGLNGLDAHLINETPEPVAVRLSLACLRDGETPIMQAARDLVLAPREATVVPATALWGGFFDTSYAYRFGPPAHDVTVARLADRNGRPLADAFHFPLGRALPARAPGLRTVLEHTERGWVLDLTTECFAQSVHIAAPGFRPDDNWFHLAPGFPRRVGLTALGGRHRPAGTVGALDLEGVVAFAAPTMDRDKPDDPPYQKRHARPERLAGV
jgi:beta-mannosidase